MCRYKNEMGSGPAQEVHSGTWPFVSALLLYYPTKQHELADDLESFIHVIHRFCIRFHEHDLLPEDIAEKLSTVYFSTRKINGYDVGTNNKLNHMRKGSTCFTLRNDLVNEGLVLIVKKLSELCKDHYGTVDFQALDKARDQILKKDLRRITSRPARRFVEKKIESDSDSEDESSTPTKLAYASLPLSSSAALTPFVSPSANQDWSILEAPSKLSGLTNTSFSPFKSHHKILKFLKQIINEDTYWTLEDKIPEGVY
ncbi:hypothetical protein C8Q75DRAFT_323905 [Abortiporus biennis]|nr:hypothetical protein C8Q75DRAFT_323905 [Abortiporus biennis]